MRSKNDGEIEQIATYENADEEEVPASNPLFKDLDVEDGNTYSYTLVTVKKDAGTNVVRTASTDAVTFVACDFSKSNIVLPEGTLEIQQEAFEGTECKVVHFNQGLQTIGARAFANCPSLTRVYIPETVTSIADDAFGDTTSLIVYGVPDSVAQSWAAEHNLLFLHLQE